MTVLLSVEGLLVLVDDLGVGPVRDVGLLDSAARRPGVVLYGHEAYPTLDLKAAALLGSLVGNHALVDGNNRLGWLAVVVFYGLNAIELDAPDDPAYELVMSVARGELELQQIAASLACGIEGLGSGWAWSPPPQRGWLDQVGERPALACGAVDQHTA